MSDCESTRFRAIVEYDGTDYHGWQFQPGLPTLQGEIEAALQRILLRHVRVHGAGRTDAGVHSVGQTAHFDTEWKRTPEELQRALNAVLPPDISIRELQRTARDFHARHSARTKTYEYSMYLSHVRRPLLRRTALHIQRPLDVPEMELAAKELVGSHDFAAFGRPTDGSESTVREIITAEIENDGELLWFTVTGTGFLRYMVRGIVGTLLKVGEGRIDALGFRAVLQSVDRSRCGTTAPPHGLCLKTVSYGDENRPRDYCRRRISPVA